MLTDRRRVWERGQLAAWPYKRGCQEAYLAAGSVPLPPARPQVKLTVREVADKADRGADHDEPQDKHKTIVTIAAQVSSGCDCSSQRRSGRTCL